MSRKKKSTSKNLRTAPPVVIEEKPFPIWVIALIVLITLLAYSNSFTGSFIYDDDQAVIKNMSIHHLWPPWVPLFPPYNLTVGGRPLLNLSFAINYAINGTDATWSYHILNFTAHILAGLTLLGVLRRTFLQPVLRERFGADAMPLAAAITLLWILNPLQTESVSYISQRAEALMALFYLLTIYCFIRFTDPQTLNPMRWAVLSVVCCTAGAAFKEILITAPFMVLLYDRTFVAGTFLRALRLRGWFYVALAACCWSMIAYGLSDYKGGRVIGWDYGVTSWDYALTECPALLHYIVLMVWPHPLIIDYGIKIYTDLDEVLAYAFGVLILLAITVLALVRWPVIGFICAWFFIILAPTSSFVPIVVSPIGEHRLYLPLLTFLVPLVLLLYLFFYRFLGLRFGFWFLVLGLASVYGVLTFLRNGDYSTDVNLWKITVEEEPTNARAHNNYGVTLLSAGRAAEATTQFQLATSYQYNYPDAHYNWGNAEAALQHYQAAIGHFQVALQQKPTLASAHNNWGNVLDALGRQTDAIEQYLMALQISPTDAQFHYNLGHAYLVLKKYPEALDQFQQALQLNPNLADAHNTIGIAFFQMGQKSQAIDEFETALRINPRLQAARDNLTKLGVLVQ